MKKYINKYCGIQHTREETNRLNKFRRFAGRASQYIYLSN